MPNDRLLRALNVNPKRIKRLRPNRSVSAPPIMLPTRPKREDSPSSTPACVIPTPNFWVIYNAKKGNSSVLPMESMKSVTTMTQKSGGNSAYVFLSFFSIVSCQE